MEGNCLLGIHDAAYPRLKSSFSENELTTIFTPTAEEMELAHCVVHTPTLRIAFLMLLKTLQGRGYFSPSHKVPGQIAEHI